MYDSLETAVILHIHVLIVLQEAVKKERAIKANRVANKHLFTTE